jgi:hypothetical protein
VECKKVKQKQIKMAITKAGGWGRMRGYRRGKKVTQKPRTVQMNGI